MYNKQAWPSNHSLDSCTILPACKSSYSNPFLNDSQLSIGFVYIIILKLYYIKCYQSSIYMMREDLRRNHRWFQRKKVHKRKRFSLTIIVNCSSQNIYFDNAHLLLFWLNNVIVVGKVHGQFIFNKLMVQRESCIWKHHL